MDLTVHSLGGTRYQGQARELITDTTIGRVTILPHHEAFGALIAPGQIAIHAGEQSQTLPTSGGLLEVLDNTVHIWVDADSGDHQRLDELIETGHAEAGRLATEARKLGLAQAHEVIDRHSVRLGVTHLHHRHHR